MSKLSKTEREKLDLSNFGDPARRLFPIMDQSDVDAAARLIGKAKDPVAVKKRIIAIAKRKGLKLPEAWQDAKSKERSNMHADFALPDGWSFNDLRQFLESELQEDFGNGKLYTIWVRDIFENFVIYQDADGALLKRSYAIMDDDVTWGESEEVVARTSYEPMASVSKMTIDFAIERRARKVEGDFAIYPASLLFRAGDYPEKQYEMTAEELWLVEQNFKPVQGNIEHTDFLRGRACEVRRVWFDGAAHELKGEVAVPIGLDDLLQDHERKLSCEWLRETKELDGLALTVRPFISDAALMSLDADLDKTGKLNVPTLDKNLQSTDNTDCKPQQQPSQSQERTMPELTRAATPTAAAEEKSQDITPGAWERLKALLGLSHEQVTQAQAAFSQGKSARELELEAEIARRDKAAADAKTATFAAQASARATQAKEMAESLLKANRIVPWQVPAFTAFFSALLDDDAREPKTVTFSLDDNGTAKEVKMSRAEFAQQVCAQLPEHNLTKEVVPAVPAETIALFSREATQFANPSADGSVDDNAYAEMMGHTDAGTRYVEMNARRNGAGKS